jgi:hypothetical protein
MRSGLWPLPPGEWIGPREWHLRKKRHKATKSSPACRNGFLQCSGRPRFVTAQRVYLCVGDLFYIRTGPARRGAQRYSLAASKTAARSASSLLLQHKRKVDCGLGFPGRLSAARGPTTRFTRGVRPLPICFNALNELPSELTGAEGSRQVTAPAVTQIKKGHLTRPFQARCLGLPH